MARGARIEIRGLKELRKKLKGIPDRVAGEVDVAMSVAAKDYENRAIDDAPINLGNLKNRISSYQVKQMDWEVVSQADYSAFVEFGTRTRVQVPADLQNYAAKFKGNSGGDAKRHIFQWCKDKGIEEKFWWPIYIKIMTVGIHPHPFFFKHRESIYKQLIEDCRIALREALK